MPCSASIDEIPSGLPPEGFRSSPGAGCASVLDRGRCPRRLGRLKIASVIDEHTRCSLLHLVERSITAERLVNELDSVFTMAGGPPKVLRMDKGPELVSRALQRFCEGQVGMSYIPPGTPWNDGYIETFHNRLRKECLNRNHWNTLFEARVVIGDFKDEHNHRHRHSALGYRTPA